MIRIHAGEPGSHPLHPFTQVAAQLAQGTGEYVELTYNNVSITIVPGVTASDAYQKWHATASRRRQQVPS